MFKKTKKNVDIPLVICDIGATHGNNQTKQNMRTKILLIAAAALAAGVVSSNAQVYSANVVGYVQVTIAGNGEYTLLANPFTDNNGNYLTNLINANNITLPKQSQCLTWIYPGGGYSTVNYNGSVWAANSVQLPPGTGFFIRNGTIGGGAPAVTNTFVGSVIVNSGGSVTNSIPAGYSMLGGTIPYAANIADAGTPHGDTNMDYGSALTVKKSQIMTYNPASGFVAVNLGGSTPPFNWASTVPITPGQGFFLNNLGTATNMVQNASY